MTDHYETLGCDRDATTQRLKEAYFRKARITHPDKTDDSSQHFLQVAEAWNTLKDVESRKAYDLQLKQRELYRESCVETYRLDQLCFDDTNDLFFVLCRCGGRYELTKGEIEDLGNLSVQIDCENCSMSVIFDCAEGGSVK